MSMKQKLFWLVGPHFSWIGYIIMLCGIAGLYLVVMPLAAPHWNSAAAGVAAAYAGIVFLLLPLYNTILAIIWLIKKRVIVGNVVGLFLNVSWLGLIILVSILGISA